MRFQPHKIRAFTLVELLVVVAIIAILIALLMPAIAAAKMEAKKAMCLGNLRTCSLGFRMYASANRGIVPNQIQINFGGGYWPWACFLAYGYTTADTNTAGYNYGQGPGPLNSNGDPATTTYISKKSIICPSNSWYALDINTGNPDISYAMYDQDPAAATTAGSGFERVTPLDGKQFFINGSLDYDVTTRTQWYLQTQKIDSPAYNVSWPVAKYNVQCSPGNTVMLGCSLETHGSFYVNGAGGVHCWGLFTTPGYDAYITGLQTVHKDKANVAYYDGHADSLTATQLDTLPDIKIKSTYDQFGNSVVLP